MTQPSEPQPRADKDEAFDPLASLEPAVSDASPASSAPEDQRDQGPDLQAELDKMRDQLLRALAETENVRRRAAKERDDAKMYAVTGFARDLLDFSDNVRRAIEAIPDDMKNAGDDRIRNLLAGLAAMEQQMLRTFEKHGIKKIIPLNENFDPNFHEVMFEAPGTGKPAGMVIQIVEPGYTLNGRLLRPARVGVAKGDGAASGRQVDTEA
jgi:molecular chaperone GrpE